MPATFDWNRDTYIFPLDEAWEFGAETTRKIRDALPCGIADDDGSVLAQTIRNAGNGDYLELGTFYGATAILASLTKKEYDIRGDVCCVDDLQFFKEDGRCAADIMNNAAMMGASIILNIGKVSPIPFIGRQFNCVFIDASHDIKSVLEDWMNVRQVASKYVVFHDYTEHCPGVLAVVKFADFRPVHISAHMAVLENK
jgi:predicted O-methyltransferase YrrM